MCEQIEKTTMRNSKQPKCFRNCWNILVERVGLFHRCRNALWSIVSIIERFRSLSPTYILYNTLILSNNSTFMFPTCCSWCTYVCLLAHATVNLHIVLTNHMNVMKYKCYNSMCCQKQICAKYIFVMHTIRLFYASSDRL